MIALIWPLLYFLSKKDHLGPVKSNLQTTLFIMQYFVTSQKTFALFLTQLRAFSSAELMSSVVVQCPSVSTYLRTSVKTAQIDYRTPEAVIMHGESICDPHLACPVLLLEFYLQLLIIIIFLTLVLRCAIIINNLEKKQFMYKICFIIIGCEPMHRK